MESACDGSAAALVHGRARDQAHQSTVACALSSRSSCTCCSRTGPTTQGSVMDMAAPPAAALLVAAEENHRQRESYLPVVNAGAIHARGRVY